MESKLLFILMFLASPLSYSADIIPLDVYTQNKDESFLGITYCTNKNMLAVLRNKTKKHNVEVYDLPGKLLFQKELESKLTKTLSFDPDCNTLTLREEDSELQISTENWEVKESNKLYSDKYSFGPRATSPSIFKEQYPNENYEKSDGCLIKLFKADQDTKTEVFRWTGKKCQEMGSAKKFIELGQNLIVEFQTNWRYQYHSIDIIDLKANEIMNRLPVAWNPIKINESSFLYGQLHGSNDLQPYVFNTNANKTQPLLKSVMPGRLYPFHIDDNFALALYNSNTSKNTIIKIKADGSSEKLMSLGMDFSDEIDFKHHTVKSTKGYHYPAYQLRPKNTPVKGTVIFVHGGGCHVSHFGYNTVKFRPQFIEIIREGYEFFAINYRGDNLGYIDNPENNRNSENCATDEIDDIFAAKDFVADNLLSENIYLWGQSHGSYLANLVATFYASEFNWNGIISTNGMWSLEMSVQEADIFAFFNKDLQPVFQSANILSPMLIRHGESDKNVGFHQVEELLSDEHLPLASKTISPFEDPKSDMFFREGNRYYPKKLPKHLEGKDFRFFLTTDEGHHLDLDHNWVPWISTLKEFLDKNRN